MIHTRNPFYVFDALWGALIAGCCAVVWWVQLDVNSTTNQSMIGGASLINRGVLTVRRGDLIVAAPLRSSSVSASASAIESAGAGAGAADTARIEIWGPDSSHPEYDARDALAPNPSSIARLILTTPNDTTAAAGNSTPSSFASTLVQHVIGGLGLTNHGTLIVQRALCRFTGALIQTGLLLATADSVVGLPARFLARLNV